MTDNDISKESQEDRRIERLEPITFFWTHIKSYFYLVSLLGLHMFFLSLFMGFSYLEDLAI